MNMDIGKIIKTKRKELGLTQSEVCEGICSVTHLSKIENNTTSVADDVIQLICKRLNINIEEEKKRIENIKLMLNKFREAMIFGKEEVVDEIADELEREYYYIENSELRILYKLYLMRYYLFKEDLDYAYKLGKELEDLRNKFSQLENNLLNHFWGIYYIVNKDGKRALEFLSNISEDYYYSSIEIDYHLSLAYSLNSSTLLSYYYGSKALEHFHKHKLFNRVIDAELVLCMQLAKGDKNEILLSISKFKELLELSSTNYTKAIILHNIGFSLMRLKNYTEAIKYFDEALKHKKRDTYLYLTSYYAKLFSKILNNDIVTKSEAERGLNISRKINSKKYEVLFQTMLFYIDNDEKLYHFLKSKAIDYFISVKLEDHIDFYGQKLIDYYKSKNDLDKALYTAEKLINAKKM